MFKRGTTINQLRGRAKCWHLTSELSTDFNNNENHIHSIYSVSLCSISKFKTFRSIYIVLTQNLLEWNSGLSFKL